jgi:hypothetical protein
VGVVPLLGVTDNHVDAVTSKEKFTAPLLPALTITCVEIGCVCDVTAVNASASCEMSNTGGPVIVKVIGIGNGLFADSADATNMVPL